MNIAGCIVKKVIETSQDLEALFGARLQYLGEVDFDQAADLEREEDTIDVYTNSAGCLIVYHVGQSFDISEVDEEIVQFVLFDLANSYFFEHYQQGTLQCRYMTTDDEVLEDEGNDILQEGDEIEEVVGQVLDEFLQAPIAAQLTKLTFKRYVFIDEAEQEKPRLPH